MAKSPPNTPEVSYEALRAELDTILADLQSQDLDVDQALKHYQRGLELTKALEQYLKTAENQVKVLQTKFTDTAE